MAIQNQPTTFPMEQPTLVQPIVGASIAVGDFVLLYDVSAGKWVAADITALRVAINV
jgi:hypothetical protein